MKLQCAVCMMENRDCSSCEDTFHTIVSGMYVCREHLIMGAHYGEVLNAQQEQEKQG